MKIKLTDGERLVVNWMIRERDPRTGPGKQGVDLSGARLVAKVRDALKLEKLNIVKDEDAALAAHYEVSELELQWIRDEMDKASDQRRFPAIYANFIVTLYDNVRSTLENETKK